MQDPIQPDGVVDSVLLAMDREAHLESERVQEAGCAALRHLAMADGNRGYIVERANRRTFGIAVICNAMTKFLDYERKNLKQSGCCSLSLLLDHQTHRYRRIFARQVVLKTMRKRETRPRFCRLASRFI